MKTVNCVIAGVLAVLLCSSPTIWASEPANNEPPQDAPLAIPGTTKVDAEHLIELVQNTPKLVLVDARIRMDRKQGYIQGSISLPNIETDCKALAKIIPDHKTPSLFYCNGVKCGRSVKSIAIAKKCGYRNLYWFRGGFEEWKQKNYPFLKD